MEGKEKASVLKQCTKAATMIYRAKEPGEFAEVERHMRAAVEVTLDQNNAATFTWMQRLAETLIGQKKFEEAESFARKAAFGFRRYGEDDENMLDCLCLQAEAMQGQRRNGEAQDLARSTLVALEKNIRRGPEHVTSLKCRAIIALTLKAEFKSVEAENLAKENIEYFNAVLLKAETVESQGSRRMQSSDKQALQKVHQFSLTVLGENLKMQRMPSIESATTVGPDDDGQYSRFSSKESAPANSNQLEAVHE